MSFKPRADRDRSDPFAQLRRSHARLRDQLDRLADAATTLRRDGSEGDAVLAVVQVSDYFDRAVARHEQDEEQSLFPQLTDPALQPVLDALTAEHRDHERMHDELRELARLADERGLAAADAQALEALARELAATYARHLQIEEQQVFPHASRVLDDAQKLAVAADMQSRRGRGGA
jgi:iron-sulfur cluster repair protein YtfE (RIC family)